MSPITRLLALLALPSTASAFPHNTNTNNTNTNNTTLLHIPASAPSDHHRRRQTVDPTFFSYSIELSSLPDYAGNATHPNPFSRNLLAALAAPPPLVRVGGTTQNVARFAPGQRAALAQTFASPGADQPAALTLGPAFFESFVDGAWPAGTRWVYGLNFFDGAEGVGQAVGEAVAAWGALGARLWGFEVGNEFDVFPVNRSAETWDLEAYVAQWRVYAEAVAGNVTAEEEPFFQAGVFASAVAGLEQLGETPWSAETAIGEGIAETGLVKTFAEHAYMGAACAGVTPLPTLEGSLLNHTFLVEHLRYFAEQAAFSVARGVPYVIGETNSIACQGLHGVSDVFGAALWSVNYALHAAAETNVSRLHFHNGTPYRYSAWQPVAVTDATTNVTTPAHVKPLYYGHLFIASALAEPEGKGRKVVTLAEEERFVGYGVYSTGNEDGDALRHVALVNLDGGQGRSVRLPAGPQYRGAEVRRLTAPAVDSAEGIAWAGRTVDGEGRITGRERVERVADSGTIIVGAGEAVLVSF